MPVGPALPFGVEQRREAGKCRLHVRECRRAAAPHAYDQVVGSGVGAGEFVLALSEGLADESLGSMPLDRVADGLADREAEPVAGEAVGAREAGERPARLAHLRVEDGAIVPAVAEAL